MDEQIRHDILKELYMQPFDLSTAVNDYACEHCPKKKDCVDDCILTDDESFEIWWKATKGQFKEV